MSYDIRFAVKVEGAKDCYAVIGEPEYSSPTYNLGKMFRKCMNWDFEQGVWYKLTDVLPKIEHGMTELFNNPQEYRKYDAPNGWGTVESAREALFSILNYFKDEWGGLQGSWNCDVPMGCIYMCW